MSSFRILICKALSLFGWLMCLANCNANKPSDLHTHQQYDFCSSNSSDPDRDGWGWENDRSCKVPPYCNDQSSDVDGDSWGWENNTSCRIVPNCTDMRSDPDKDGWGWEQNTSCRITAHSHNDMGPGSKSPLFDSTYYPYGNEIYDRTTCGSADEHQGLYFAVTEKSRLWNGACDNDHWAECGTEDCLGKWSQLPADAKRWSDGKKFVREPSCQVPCGKKFRVYSEDQKLSVDAQIWDACPSMHWNNRFKEVNEGKNPCAQGSLHVDLRKPLYLRLNNWHSNGNIRVLIEPL